METGFGLLGDDTQTSSLNIQTRSLISPRGISLIVFFKNTLQKYLKPINTNIQSVQII